jgi:hypothetical protein
MPEILTKASASQLSLGIHELCSYAFPQHFFHLSNVASGVRQSLHFFVTAASSSRTCFTANFQATDVGGIWLSLEERSPLLEEDFLPVVEVYDADTVLFADLRDRHVLDEVLAQDGNLLLTGKIDTPGHWRYPFSDCQILAHFRLVRPEDSKQWVYPNSCNQSPSRDEYLTRELFDSIVFFLVFSFLPEQVSFVYFCSCKADCFLRSMEPAALADNHAPLATDSGPTCREL